MHYLILHFYIEKKSNIELHIRMNSEGSRDTKNWCNDAENTVLLSLEYITFYKI